MTDTNKPWLLFDYDDTLGGVWMDGQVRGNDYAYMTAINSFKALMHTQGFDQEHSRDLQSGVDHILCKQHGFADINRFAHSMLLACHALYMTETRSEPDSEILRQVYDIGMSVFEHPYVPLPGVMDTLKFLKPQYNISVVTKGNSKEQRRKLMHSGVCRFIDSFIVLSFKDMKDWQMVLSTLRIGHQDFPGTWAIGNSPKSDVNVPLDLGLNAIHVKQGGWAFEQEAYINPQAGRTLLTVNTISEILPILL